MRTLLRRLRYAVRMAVIAWQLADSIHKLAISQRRIDELNEDIEALADLEYDVQVGAGEKLIEREMGR